MSVDSVPESGSNPGARDSRLVGWLLLLPLPLGLLAFGAVHPAPRLLLALLCAGLGAFALLSVPRDRAATPALLLTLIPAVLATALSLLSLLPVAHGGRAAWQPGFTAALDALLSLAGQPSHSLALVPSRSLASIGFVASLLVFSAGVALAARSRRRQLRLAVGVVGSALAFTLLGLVQRGTGARAIYWFSSVEGGGREPFFGSLVNANHAGILLAAAVPLAIALAMRSRKEWRLVGTIAALLLCVGIAATRSRGALLECGVAIAVYAMVAQGRRVALPMGALGAVALVASLAAGLRQTVTQISEGLVPGSVHHDAFGSRLELWADGLLALRAAPWLGVGMGGYGDAHTATKRSLEFALPEHAHQELLQVLVENGVFIGLIWVGVVLVPVGLALSRALALPRGRRRNLLAGWLGAASALFLGALWDFPLRIGALAVLFALVLGVLVAAAGREDAPAVASPRQRLQVRGLALTLGLLAALAPLSTALNRWAPDSAWADPAPAWQQAQRAWAEAEQAASAGLDPKPMLVAAERASRSVLARRPLHFGAALMVARCRLGQGDLHAAAGAADAALLGYPQAPAGWLLRARIARLAGDHEGARAAWRRALAVNLPGKDDARPYIERALSEEAEPARMADRLLPDRADRLRDGAAILAARGDRPFAEGLFERAVALDPATGVAYGRWLVAWGEGARALEVLKAVPRPACRSHLLIGQAASLVGDSAAALRAFRRAQGACSGADQAAARLGMDHAAAIAGDRQALARLQQQQRQQADDPGLRRLLIVALRASGQLEAEREALEGLVLQGEALPAEVDAWRALSGLDPQP